MSGFQTKVALDLPKPSEQLPEVTNIRASDFEVTCPECGHVAEAWARDPRGTTDKCDECGMEYRIPSSVQINFR